MRIPAGSKGPNPLERSLPVQLVLPTPKENRVLLPFATPLARRDLLPLRRILGDAARVKLGPRGRRQVIARLGCPRDRSGGRPNWTDRAALGRESERRRKRRLSFCR